MMNKKLPQVPPKQQPSLSFSSPNFDEVAFINQLLPETHARNFPAMYRDVNQMFE